MAEYEGVYCTGCGFPAGSKGLFRGLHRPYCWRVTTMMLDVEPTNERIAKCLSRSAKHWKLLAWLIRDPSRMYYHEDQEWVTQEDER